MAEKKSAAGTRSLDTLLNFKIRCISDVRNRNE